MTIIFGASHVVHHLFLISQKYHIYGEDTTRKFTRGKITTLDRFGYSRILLLVGDALSTANLIISALLLIAKDIHHVHIKTMFFALQSFASMASVSSIMASAVDLSFTKKFFFASTLIFVDFGVILLRSM